ncbi:MAG: hypothetical protein ACOC38_10860 [Promethearchaeia archaeon]
MTDDSNPQNAWFSSENGLSRLAEVRRLIVVILLLDLIGMVWFGRVITGDPLNGLFWPTPNMMLFPIPRDFGSWTPVVSPLSPLDAFVYTVFIYGGLWIVWCLVAILYIVYPYVPPLRTRVDNLKAYWKHT